MIYHQRRSSYIAAQFNGTTACIKEIERVIDSEFDSSTITTDILGVEFEGKDEKGKHYTLMKGDWLVRLYPGKENEAYVVSERHFIEHYEQRTEQSTAQPRSTTEQSTEK